MVDRTVRFERFEEWSEFCYTRTVRPAGLSGASENSRQSWLEKHYARA